MRDIAALSPLPLAHLTLYRDVVEWIAAVASLTAVVLLVVLLLQRRGESTSSAVTASEPTSRVPAVITTDVEPAPRSQIELIEEADGYGLREVDTHVLLARFVPQSPTAAQAVAAPSWLAAGVRQLLDAESASKIIQRPQPYRVVFTDETTKLLRSGQASMTRAARGDLPLVRGADGRFIELGTIIGGGALAINAVALLTAGAAVAAALGQQQQMDGALKRIGRQLRAVEARMRDSEYGELAAALELAAHTRHLTDTGPLPHQLRLELAAARSNANAVYFARRRHLERVIAGVEGAQTRAEERTGRPARAWERGVADQLGDPDDLEADVVLYLQAAFTRAQLAGASALVMAGDGDTPQAMAVLDATADELRGQLTDLDRRLRALAAYEPTGLRNRSEHQRLHQTVTALHRTLSNELLPAIPQRPGTGELSFVIELRQLPAPPPG